MFVSQPQYEFPFPPDLEQPGSQHWRMVELTLHAPWFLLTVEIVDAALLDCSLSRTGCCACAKAQSCRRPRVSSRRAGRGWHRWMPSWTMSR